MKNLYSWTPFAFKPIEYKIVERNFLGQVSTYHHVERRDKTYWIGMATGVWIMGVVALAVVLLVGFA